MRYTLLSASLLLLGSTEAQFVEMADQRRPDVVYNKIIDLGDRFVIGAWENRESEVYGGAGHFINIVAYDGAEIASARVPMSMTGEWDWGVVSALTRSPSGGFYVAGYWDECDYAELSRLIHFAPDGTVLFETFTPWTSDYGGYDDLAEDPSEFLAFISNSEIAITDLLGDSITSWENPNPGTWQTPTFARWLPTGDMLLTAGDRMQVVDTSGSTLYAVQLEEVIHDTRLYEDEILALGADSIYRFSLELAPLGGTPNTADGSDPKFLSGDIVYFQAGDQLWVWNNVETALVLETELLEGQTIRSMAVRNDTLYACGINEAHGFSAGLLRSYALDGFTSSHEVDAAIESVVVDSAWTYPATWNPNYLYIRADLEITIRNYGTDPIESLVLGRRLGIPAAMCGDPSGQIPVDDLPLMPGSSMTMLAENILISIWPTFSQNDIISNICIVAQSPNGHVDRDHSNDKACVNLTTPLSVNEPQAGPLTVFPNPFVDQLTIRSPTSGPPTIRLFDASGRVVFDQRISGSATISLPELANGSYVIEATDGVHQWRQILMRVDQ